MTPNPDEPVHPDAIIPAGGADPAAPADGAGADPLAALLGGGGEGGGFDFGALMEQASQMQAHMLAAQQQAAEAVLEGVAGGGAVRIEVTGGLDFRSVSIDPKAVDPDDVDMLQDLVLAALRHAVDQINELTQSGMGDLDLGGVDLGDLFGN